MTYRRPLYTSACIIMLSFAATAFAAPSENNDPASRKAEMLKNFDTDGDGKLSDAERTALRTEMQNRRGGKERKQWSPEQRAEMLKKFDTDGDGELSQEERNAAREAMKASQTRGGKPRKEID